MWSWSTRTRGKSGGGAGDSVIREHQVILGEAQRAATLKQQGVNVTGFGLTANVTGQLDVRERPGAGRRVGSG